MTSSDEELQRLLEARLEDVKEELGSCRRMGARQAAEELAGRQGLRVDDDGLMHHSWGELMREDDVSRSIVTWREWLKEQWCEEAPWWGKASPVDPRNLDGDWLVKD